MSEEEENNNREDERIKIILDFLQNIPIEEIISIIKSIYEDKNRTDIEISKITKETEIEKSKPNELDIVHNKRLFRFHERNLFKEGLITVLILGTIITLSLFNKLDNSTIGTLLGSIIGYTIGSFGKYKGSKEK